MEGGRTRPACQDEDIVHLHDGGAAARAMKGVTQAPFATATAIEEGVGVITIGVVFNPDSGMEACDPAGKPGILGEGCPEGREGTGGRPWELPLPPERGGKGNPGEPATPGGKPREPGVVE